MFCNQCGSELNERAEFCSNCGNKVNMEYLNKNQNSSKDETDYIDIGEVAVEKMGEAMDAIKNKAEAYKAESDARKRDHIEQLNRATSGFVEDDEKVIAELGKGYGTNVLFGNLKKINATLTNRRVYFQGTMYDGGRGIRAVNKITKTQIIDLDDVTGTGFIYTRLSYVSLVIAVVLAIIGLITSGDFEEVGGILLISAIIPFVYFIIKYIVSRRVLFFVEYAGGEIQFDARLIGLSNVTNFHMQMRRAKEAIKKRVG